MIRSHGTIDYVGHMLVSGTFKTNESQARLVRVLLSWKSHCVNCIPAEFILYHVIGSCKMPIKCFFFAPYHN